MRTSRLGNKSLDMGYVIREIDTGQIFAEAKTVQVAYDYQMGKTIPIQKNWRERLKDFEGLHD